MTSTATFTAQQVANMRAWMSDCLPEQVVEELSDERVARWVARNYAGGMDGFVKDSADAEW